MQDGVRPEVDQSVIIDDVAQIDGHRLGAAAAVDVISRACPWGRYVGMHMHSPDVERLSRRHVRHEDIVP